MSSSTFLGFVRKLNFNLRLTIFSPQLFWSIPFLVPDNVDIINDLVLNRVPGELRTLEGRTLLNHELLECDLDDALSVTDYLSTLQHSGVLSHILKLNVGVCVMITTGRNLDVSAGLTNGVNVVVKSILPFMLLVSTLKDRTIHWIPRITFSFITWQGADVKRVRFPVRLCFAVTDCSP